MNFNLIPIFFTIFFIFFCESKIIQINNKYNISYSTSLACPLNSTKVTNQLKCLIYVQESECSSFSYNSITKVCLVQNCQSCPKTTDLFQDLQLNFARRDKLLLCQTLYTGQYLTSGDGRYIAKMQSNGNFEVIGSRVLWSSNTTGATHLTLTAQGILKIFNGQTEVWSFIGKHLYDSIAAGTNIQLIMQSDGNLVSYNNLNQPAWHTGTFNQY